MPGLRDVRIDLRTSLFAIAASLSAAILAGVIPALGVFRTRLAGWLAERSGGTGAGGMRAQQMLAVGQIGLAAALLVTAALLVESFRQLRSVDPGFHPARVTTAKVTIPASRYPDAPSRVRFVDSVLTGMSRLPNVAAAGVIDAVPIADNRQGTEFIRLDAPSADPSASPNANVAWITEGYFEALGIPVLAGRTINARDTPESQPVVIVNRRLARQVFGSSDPIGRLVRIGVSAQRQFEVVGVVGDERHFGIDIEATPSFFVAYRQAPSGRDLGIVVRIGGAVPAASRPLVSFLGPLAPNATDAMDVKGTVGAIRDVVRRIDPELALFRVQTMEKVVDNAVATPRSIAWLLSVFAIAALMLAAIGVFGVLSHAVGQRTREIGVRMAIGASPSQVLGSILAEGLAQVGFGLVLGALLSLLTARLLGGLLFGVSALSVTPYLIVVCLLGTVSLIACLLPARRAMQIDPAVALRSD